MIESGDQEMKCTNWEMLNRKLLRNVHGIKGLPKN